eukprot:SAG31_NODE_3233_length_4512_cov_72.476773_5_plen_218_part_00
MMAAAMLCGARARTGVAWVLLLARLLSLLAGPTASPSGDDGAPSDLPQQKYNSSVGSAAPCQTLCDGGSLVPPPAPAPYPLVTLEKYVDTLGARCLDGSAAAFFIRQGAHTLNDSYIIDFCGGGWCYDEASCLGRSGDHLLGSSRYLPKDGGAMGLATGGLLSDSPQTNPDFWNWAKVFVIYCEWPVHLRKWSSHCRMLLLHGTRTQLIPIDPNESQ